MLDSLPPMLAERSEALNDQPPRPDGEFVLYWMHHSMRAHDNPSLDAALVLAEQLDVPVLVYQGLGGRHPFNSDRHHWFILQGARDVARELQSAGIAYACHLGQPSKPSPLNALIERASAVVVENMPVAPFKRWQPSIANRASCAVVRVDSRCIVPMTLSRKAPSRAFAFRDKFKREYAQRLPAGWLPRDSTVTNSAIALPFTHFDVAKLDDQQLLSTIAKLDIDHDVGPIADTPGGSIAGYRRWDVFKRNGLKSYAKTRNDAALDWPRSVSRLSAYFHYGMISPFRIAQEATTVGGGGADKFLDELTIWREVAHHFCYHTDDPDRLEALPSWAQQTLEAHSGDTREHCYSLSSLAAARTHSALWNLCQQSLLVHGELHNNLRMTWAKAIAAWTPTPTDALRALTDLNHRYALDGNDPSSYGGLLWSLGLFDRPFTPEQPILGSVRGRSVSAHAKRLDMGRYAERIRRPQGMRLRVAVIGAGTAGLNAAAILATHQHDVQVFEKSRGPGGRNATRRREDYRFDHGAQYFTACDPRFQRRLPDLECDGVVERLVKTTAVLPARSGVSPSTTRERWRGAAGMNRLCKYLAEGLPIETGTRIVSLQRDGQRWQLRSETGLIDAAYDVVLIAAPAPQAAVVLQSSAPQIAKLASSVRFSPCWALMLRTDKMPEGYDAAFVNQGPIVWMAGEQANDGSYCWVLHANTSWSEAHLEQTAEWIAEQMSASFTELTSLVPLPDSLRAHRWRYGRPVNPLSVDCLYDRELGIGACGDWCHDDARTESAWLSGQAVAGRVLAHAVVLGGGS
ncbi:MAG: FAD-dependent oxidoreductase [Pseudomonadota bacterium]